MRGAAPAQQRAVALRTFLRSIGADSSLSLVTLASAVAAAVFIMVGVFRHRSYHSAAMDFAFFDQIVWNTSQGRWFETSFTPYNFLGQHVEPVLLVFALLYRVTPAPEWMLVVQAVVASGAAILLYLVARERVRCAWLAALIAVSYLLSPVLHDAIAFDFHPEVLAPAFVFGGVLLLIRRRTGWAVALFLGTLLLKEDAALVLVGLALPLWFLRERRVAVTVAAAGTVWIIVVVGLFMPAVRGESSDLEARYAHLGAGTGVGGIARGLVQNPGGAATHIASTDSLYGVARQLVPQAGLPLLASLWLPAAVPVALLQFLSAHDTQQQLRIQYGAQVLPLVMLATVDGFRRIERKTIHRQPLFIAATALFAVFMAVGAVLFSPVKELDQTFGRQTNRAAVERALDQVPPRASVSAQSGLAAHLSQRREIWEFPVLEHAQFVILDLDGVVSRPYQDVFDSEVEALPSHGYQLIWSEGSLRVYERTSP